MNMSIEQVQSASKLITPIVGTTVTLSTIGTVISLVAGILTIIYTVLRIVDWYDARKEKKANKK